MNLIPVHSLLRTQAYGESGFPAWGIGPNATLTFEIEILKIA
jgi:FKBP-type peptidyl-prolyl cis-trans isomerase